MHGSNVWMSFTRALTPRSNDHRSSAVPSSRSTRTTRASTRSTSSPSGKSPSPNSTSTSHATSTTLSHTTSTTTNAPLVFSTLAGSIISTGYPPKSLLGLTTSTATPSTSKNTVRHESAPTSTTSTSTQTPTTALAGLTTQQTLHDESLDKTLSIVIGVGIGVIALLIMAAIFLLLWRRKKHTGNFFLGRPNATPRSTSRTSWTSFDFAPFAHGALSPVEEEEEHQQQQKLPQQDDVERFAPESSSIVPVAETFSTHHSGEWAISESRPLVAPTPTSLPQRLPPQRLSPQRMPPQRLPPSPQRMLPPLTQHDSHYPTSPTRRKEVRFDAERDFDPDRQRRRRIASSRRPMQPRPTPGMGSSVWWNAQPSPYQALPRQQQNYYYQHPLRQNPLEDVETQQQRYYQHPRRQNPFFEDAETEDLVSPILPNRNHGSLVSPVQPTRSPGSLISPVLPTRSPGKRYAPLVHYPSWDEVSEFDFTGDRPVSGLRGRWSGGNRAGEWYGWGKSVDERYELP